MFVYFLVNREYEQVRFVSTRENYETFDDLPYILRLFVQKYGGTWDTYESLRQDVKEKREVLYKYNIEDFKAEVLAHDDRRWVKEMPPLRELVGNAS
jgi:hypothetical protein